MGKLSWSEFEYNSSNYTGDFEKMCRLYFKLYFFDSKTIFLQSPNHPGIEVEPIDFNNKKISFQSKYFSGSISYRQLESSIDAVIRNYSSKDLDIIYVFSNKDFTLTSVPYKRICTKLQKIGITIIPITNQSILETIEINKNMLVIKKVFFGKNMLTNDWFLSNLEASLDDLSSRYDRNFNVRVDLQDKFEYIFKSKKSEANIKKIFMEQIKELKSYVKVDKSKIEKIEKLYLKLSNFSIINFEDYKNHIIEFKDNIKEVKSSINEHKTSNSVENNNKKLLDELRRLARNMENIIYYIEKIIIDLYYNKVCILEGDAGSGKSHLMGFVAEQHGIDGNVILLLGQKLINDNEPWTQVCNQLNISNNLDDFLDTLDGIGAVNNAPMVIMLDAINESAYHKIWQKYLNSLITKVMKYDFIKLIISIRSTYKNVIFDDVIKRKIEANEIKVLTHYGFSNQKGDPVAQFFNKYNILISSNIEVPEILNNPLILKLFCEINKNKEIKEHIRLDEIYNTIVKQENIKINKDLEINDHYNYEAEIISYLIKEMLNSGLSFITRNNLPELLKSNTIYYNYLNKMLHGQVLFSYFNENEEEIIYFRYEKLFEYFASKIIVRESNNNKSLIEVITKYSNSLYNDNNIIISLILMVFELLDRDKKYDFLDVIIKHRNINNKEEVLSTLLEHFSIIEKNEVILKRYFKITKKLFRILGKPHVYSIMFKTILARSTELKFPLNVNELDKILTPMKMVERDYLWTITINDLYIGENQSIMKYVDLNRKKIDAISVLEKNLLMKTLVWMLSSSNRNLRDRISRNLVDIFCNDVDMMVRSLEEYLDINDPYIRQRLLATVYGGIIRSNVSFLDSIKLSKLSNIIIKNIFDKKYISEDILLRDYARNIIEYLQHKKCINDVDLSIIRPPYRSKPLKKTNRKKIRTKYKFNTSNASWYGTALNRIKNSMAPNVNSSDGIGMYGDFGRYVFQSGMSNFKGIDIEEMYYASLDIILNEMKFTNIFSEYDTKVQSIDRSANSNERIGKKYQWIAAYKLWGIASDTSSFSNVYEDSENNFQGPWEPYVRDFDPTLELKSNDRQYDFPNGLDLSSNKYTGFNLDDKNWITNHSEFFNYEKLLKFKDLKNHEWICLFVSQNDKSEQNDDLESQEVWREAGAFFYHKESKDEYISLLKDKFYWGRWFYHPHSLYQLFSREYFWSPASNYFFTDYFETINVPLDSYHEEIVKVPRFKNDKLSDLSSEDEKRDEIDLSFELVEMSKEFNDVQPINVMQSWVGFSWEEEYDKSKISAISYTMPAKLIVENFSLDQLKNGMWYNQDDLICCDMSLIKGTDKEGLFIRKDYLDKFLSDNELHMFWVGLGEQNYIKKISKYAFSERSIFLDSSVFIEYTSKGIIKHSMLVGNRNDNNSNLKVYTEKHVKK